MCRNCGAYHAEEIEAIRTAEEVSKILIISETVER
jgi:hypothetical protein